MDDIIGASIVKLLAAAMGVGGLYLIINGLHLTHKYMNISNVPPSFIKARVKFCGQLDKIEPDGSLLIEHVPVIGFFNEEFNFKKLATNIFNLLKSFTPLELDQNDNNNLEKCLKFNLWGLSHPLSSQAMQWINEVACGSNIYFQIMDLPTPEGEIESEQHQSCVLYYKPQSWFFINPFYYMLNKQLLKLGLAQCDTTAIHKQLVKSLNQSDDDDILNDIRRRYDLSYKPSDHPYFKKSSIATSPFDQSSTSLPFEAQLAIALYAAQSRAQKRGLGPWSSLGTKNTWTSKIFQPLKYLFYSVPPGHHNKIPPTLNNDRLLRKIIKFLARTK